MSDKLLEEAESIEDVIIMSKKAKRIRTVQRLKTRIVSLKPFSRKEKMPSPPLASKTRFYTVKLQH